MIEVSQEGALWHVRLNRPEKANSLTRAMLTRLAETAEEAAGKAQAFVISGEGKVFSAGMDLVEAQAGLATDPVWERLSGAVAALPCLTVAALNGTLAGGAFGMALACDLRVCVPETHFFYPVMKLGFLPQPSDPRRLAALIGPARAKLILMGGAKLNSDEAMRFGLVDAVVPRSELEPFVATLCEDALGADAGHVTAIKGMF
ncbi:MAG: enoyl-CoA hydratase/isomerase family protein [Rhodobacter sp.]|nr:enoyl-CoA hydratase/isomerase family protein [Rhodobacter sp.]